MAAIDIFAWFIFITIIVVVVVAVVWAATFPGKLAAQREHPQADAIKVAGIIGVFTFGIVWVLALIWAFTRPVGHSADLQARVEQLEAKLAELEGAQS